AVVEGDTTAASSLAAALCDFLIGNEDATYGFANCRAHLHPWSAEATLVSERFGAARAQDILYLSTASTGRQLCTKGWTCPILPAAQLDAYVSKLVSTLAEKPPDW